MIFIATMLVTMVFGFGVFIPSYAAVIMGKSKAWIPFLLSAAALGCVMTATAIKAGALR